MASRAIVAITKSLVVVCAEFWFFLIHIAVFLQNRPEQLGTEARGLARDRE
jgi:hypothetical protein